MREYEVIQNTDGGKEIVWCIWNDESALSPVDIIKAAEKEFPGKNLEELRIQIGGYDGEYSIILSERRK